MSFNYSQPIIVVSAFIVRDDKVLLIQENHYPDKGKWNLPGGKLDFSESPIDAIKCEIHEEVGLFFEPTELLGIESVYRNDLPTALHSLRVIFMGEAKGDVGIENGESVDGVDEISGFKWLSIEEISLFDERKLRYYDIKYLAQRYSDGVSFPIGLLQHFVQVP